MAQSLNLTLERTFSNYLSTKLVACGVKGYNITQGLSLDEKQLPVIYVNCNRLVEEFPFSAIYRATLVIDVITQADAPNSYSLNSTAIGTIRDIMSDLGAIQTALNMPFSGADTRVEKEITVHGLYEDGIEVGHNLQSETVRCIGGTLQYQVYCQAAPYPFITNQS